ncbi:MAG: rRNA maturation RNase YbeY [Phycisphaerales bacterium]|nr:rRNA maturation RNase YbeY [Phycisphaerales bacterium]
MIQVEVLDSQRLLSEQAYTTLSGLAMRALECLGCQGQVRVSIVDDRRMSIAHEKFSGITGTTDVLSFDLADPNSLLEEKTLDTDLTVCFDEAVRQASKLNHPVEHELLLYIIHGTLHCLGYDDHDDAAYQRMHAKEDKVLNQIGIAPTFFVQPDPSTKENRS